MTPPLPPPQPSPPPAKSRRGFASMSPERMRAVASMGGKAAQALGKSHKWTSAEASVAAARGHALGVAHQFTPAEAALAGRKGGLTKHANLRAAKAVMV